jgi:hypothetical protein
MGNGKPEPIDHWLQNSTSLSIPYQNSFLFTFFGCQAMPISMRMKPQTS